MSRKTTVNEAINISAWYFTRQLTTYPRRMEWGGASYTFRDGLQYCITKAGEVTRIFDMTDGHQSFRLKCAGESDWTLVAITEHA